MRFLPPVILACGVASSAMLVAFYQNTASAHMTPYAPVAWGPPEWLPDAELLADLPALDQHAPDGASIPGLSAHAAFVYDVDANEVLYERNADNRRSVASLTKMVSALAMASEGADLDQELCIDQRFWPNRNGAKSKLSTGECYQGWDLAGAALVASDNRGAFGMQVASGLPYHVFVDRMNDVSEQLLMTQSTFVDPSGLEDDNLSTARDMAKAVIALSAHPTLSVMATAPEWQLVRTDKPQRRWLGSTDRIVARKNLEVLSAKTGYTDTAAYCFAAVVRTETGRTLALSILGAPTTGSRWGDVDRILNRFK